MSDEAGKPATDSAEAFKLLLDKHKSDATDLARTLHEEVLKLRRKNAVLREQASKAPADGAAVLTPDEAKAWTAYQALGSAEDVQKAIDDAKSLQGKLAESERRDLLAKAAEAHGFKPSVLTRLLGADAAVEIKETEKDGKPVKVAWVREGEETKDLDAYAEANWPEFMPALRAEAAAKEQVQAGTQFVRQSGGGGRAPKQDPAQVYIGKAYATPKKGS